MEKSEITVEPLKEHLEHLSSHLQQYASHSNADPESIYLFDELARHSFYMFADIIDYLEQNQ